MCVCLFFFFKQKTAYEMRISDWSSDVCSSDLNPSDPLLHDLVEPLGDLIPRSHVAVLTERQGIDVVGDADRLLHVLVDDEDGVALLLQAGDLLVDFVDELRHEPDGGLVEQPDRKSVGWGKRVSVRVELG